MNEFRNATPICFHKCKRMLAEDLHAKHGCFTFMHAACTCMFIQTTVVCKGATHQAEDIQIFDDEINEAPEVFNLLLNVLSEQRSNVIFRIQRTLCRIRQSDRKLICKYFMHLTYTFLNTELLRLLSSVLHLVTTVVNFVSEL